MRISKLSKYKEVFPFLLKPPGNPPNAAWFSASFKVSFVLLTVSEVKSGQTYHFLFFIPLPAGSDLPSWMVLPWNISS